MSNKFLNKAFRNLPYKVLALVLACLLWGIVQGEQILEINRRIIVNIEVPDGMAIKGSTSRIKDATLRGPRALLGDFSARPLEANIKIPKGKIGQVRFRIDKEYIKAWDNRIKLTVHDAYLTVKIDKKMTRRVQVKEFITGVPADGYFIEKATIEPPFVDISTLRSELAKISEILTEPIDVSDISQSKTFNVGLVAKNFDKSHLETQLVKVSLLVGEKKENKEFKTIAIEVVGSQYLSSVTPEYASITLQGTRGVLQFVKSPDLKAVINARSLKPGRYDKEIQVSIPTDTVEIEHRPQKVIVEIYNQKKVK